MSPGGADDVPIRVRSAHDGPVPAGNATMLAVLGTLWHRTGEVVWRERADALLRAFAGEVRRQPTAHATFLLAATLLEEPVQIVLVGGAEDAGLQALERAAWGTPVPARLQSRIVSGASLPPGHPAHGKTTVQGRAAAYVCVGPTCRLPVTEPAALRRELAALHAGSTVG